MDRLAGLAIEHLLYRMRMLNRTIAGAVERQRAANATLVASKGKGVYLSDAQVGELLERADAFVSRASSPPTAANASADDALVEQDLRRHAVIDGHVLPFDRLARNGLTRQEQDALTLAAAPELDRSYERIYAFILDDLTRCSPNVALLSELTCVTQLQRAWSLHVFGPFGSLRRRRLLVATGDARLEARQELRLGPGVLDFLLGGHVAPESLFRDRADVVVPPDAEIPLGTDTARATRIASLLRDGRLEIVGVWGSDPTAVDRTVRAICSAASIGVRRLVAGDVRCREACPREEVRKAFLAASTLQTCLWVEIDQLIGEAGEAAIETLAEQMQVSPLRIIVSGKTPWRPTDVLAARAYGEIEIESPRYSLLREMWQSAMGAQDTYDSEALAARFRFNSREIAAAVRVARTSAAISGNGRAAPLADHIDAACATVSRRQTVAFARVIAPRRRAADLVLPRSLYGQVLEIPRMMRSWPRFGEDWGFTRRDPSSGALKVLFTGDSGTGKTLAAEVIAGELGVQLVKVDLARVVSKWVGETEKNLAAVFDEAKSMPAVLFFDEADALFGRRGEVQRGVDRYANLEVSYLLQRLEEHDAGVVILASNLKDNMDSAFTRRFQVSLHFPRPATDLRRRMWRLAIPDDAPIDGIDFDVLARVDLTGGGIVGAARTAAMLAADSGSGAILMEHVVRGVARQFKREARLLNPAELGTFAALVNEP